MERVFKNKKLSVIIPAYNASKTLERAVLSVLNNLNSLFEIEILIVENGSTDNTSKIIEKLCLKFPGEIIFLQSEKGVSNARNLGIRHSSGEWITFLDSDDYLTKNALEDFFAVSDSDADIIAGNFLKGNSNQVLYSQKKKYSKDEYMEFVNHLISNPTKYMTVWGKFYKKSVISKNFIEFDNKMMLSEDSDFLISVFLNSSTLLTLPKTLYVYSIDNVSTTRSYHSRKLNNYIESLNITFQKYRDGERVNPKALSYYFLMNLNVLIVKEIMSSANKVSFLQKTNTIRMVCENEIFVDSLCKVKMKECLKPRLLPIMLMKLKLYSVAGIIYRCRAIFNERKVREI